MSDGTKIGWTRGDDGSEGATWNPVVGCARISAGCGDGTGGGCYAERLAHRLALMGQARYDGLTRMTANGPRWTGKTRLVESALAIPLKWRRPRRIFVCSMADLFHESVSDEQIAAVFGVMAAAPQHTYIVLTKRAERLPRWSEWIARRALADAPIHADSPWWPVSDCLADLATATGTPKRQVSIPDAMWPLPNVWLGVSVENQATADERIPHLLATPAAVRFVSAEPLLGPIKLHAVWLHARCEECGVYRRRREHAQCLCGHYTPGADRLLDWVIAGGESGPGARPCDLAWIRSLRDQCKAAGVPVFVKQMGARPILRGDDIPEHLWTAYDANGYSSTEIEEAGSDGALRFNHRAGADPSEWPSDLRVQEFPAD